MLVPMFQYFPMSDFVLLFIFIQQEHNKLINMYNINIYYVIKYVFFKLAVLLNFIFIPQKRQANRNTRMNSEGSCHTGIMLK